MTKISPPFIKAIFFIKITLPGYITLFNLSEQTLWVLILFSLPGFTFKEYLKYLSSNMFNWIDITKDGNANYHNRCTSH